MRWLRIASVLLGAAVLLAQQRTAPDAGGDKPSVVTVRLSGEAITPVTARYIERAIEQAENTQATCLVILLDTPGGLVDSTREIVKNILGSRIPVVVYVAPAGARAASAGVFITMAAHVAAMAPGTNIGAAHPVQIGGLPGRQPEPEQTKESKESASPTPMDDKIVSDTAAWARSLAELRGRNVEWIAHAVRESASASASEALREGVIDLIADDLSDLLRKIDGRQVNLPQGTGTLHTAGAEVRPQEMWWGERLLAAIANPTLALLLLIFGFYGVLFELYTPGWGVPGTIGAICLVLGFFALAVLPINLVGLLLIGIALALFVAEAFVTSYGLLTIGGLACLIMGGLMLVDSPAGFLRVSLWTLVPIALATAAITIFLVGGVIKTSRTPIRTGSESMPGSAAVADTDFTADGERYSGTVRTHGELWAALCASPVSAGDALEVLSREGLTLLVRPVKPQPSQPESIGTQRQTHVA
jgi:membrane-bound serine protease (ClpP class)